MLHIAPIHEAENENSQVWQVDQAEAPKQLVDLRIGLRATQPHAINETEQIETQHIGSSTEEEEESKESANKGAETPRARETLASRQKAQEAEQEGAATDAEGRSKARQPSGETER